MINWEKKDTYFSNLKTFLCSALGAFIFECMLLAFATWNPSWLMHTLKNPKKNESPMIETEIFEIPPHDQMLSEEKKAPALSKKLEVQFNKNLNKGKLQPQKKFSEEKNETKDDRPLSKTHGPITLFAPLPTIPLYLQKQDFNSYVVIDFYIDAQGSFKPKLIQSSGHEELDAIAIKKVSEWKFQPAVKNDQPTASKVRVRIIFEVK